MSFLTGMSSVIGIVSIQGVGCSLLPEGGGVVSSSEPWGSGRQIVVGTSGALPTVFCPNVSLLVSVVGVVVGGHGICSSVHSVVGRRLIRVSEGGYGDSPM